jgi:hypothetical protein
MCLLRFPPDIVLVVGYHHTVFQLASNCCFRSLAGVVLWTCWKLGACADCFALFSPTTGTPGAYPARISILIFRCLLLLPVKSGLSGMSSKVVRVMSVYPYMLAFCFSHLARFAITIPQCSRILSRWKLEFAP